jgi:hypothetical protein
VETEDAIRKALSDFFWIIDNYCEVKTTQNAWKERLIKFWDGKPFKS